MPIFLMTLLRVYNLRPTDIVARPAPSQITALIVGPLLVLIVICGCDVVDILGSKKVIDTLRKHLSQGNF